MPTLLDRYIYAVERHLPQAERHDIGAELREMVQSRIDEDAATRGRDLTDDEVGDILKAVGRPVVVAGRYATSQYLIGPTVFPYYKATLRTLAYLGAPLLVIAMVVGAAAADNPSRGALDAIARSATTALAAFALATIVFWQMERLSPKQDLDDHWVPQALPDPPKMSRGVPRAYSISQTILLATYLLWWVDVLPLTRLLRLVPAGVGVPELAPVWQDVSLAITIVMSVGLVTNLLNAWRPQVPKWRLATQLTCDLVALGVLYYLVNADALVVAPASGLWTGLADRLNDITTVGLLGLGALLVLSSIDGGRRLFGIGPPDGGGPLPSFGPALHEWSRTWKSARGMRHLKDSLRPPKLK
jgi:hypothetical protein